MLSKRISFGSPPPAVHVSTTSAHSTSQSQSQAVSQSSHRVSASTTSVVSGLVTSSADLREEHRRRSSLQDRQMSASGTAASSAAGGGEGRAQSPSSESEPAFNVFAYADERGRGSFYPTASHHRRGQRFVVEHIRTGQRRPSTVSSTGSATASLTGRSHSAVTATQRVSPARGPLSAATTSSHSLLLGSTSSSTRHDVRQTNSGERAAHRIASSNTSTDSMLDSDDPGGFGAPARPANRRAVAGAATAATSGSTTLRRASQDGGSASSLRGRPPPSPRGTNPGHAPPQPIATTSTPPAPTSTAPSVRSQRTATSPGAGSRASESPSGRSSSGVRMPSPIRVDSQAASENDSVLPAAAARVAAAVQRTERVEGKQTTRDRPTTTAGAGGSKTDSSRSATGYSQLSARSPKEAAPAQTAGRRGDRSSAAAAAATDTASQPNPAIISTSDADSKGNASGSHRSPPQQQRPPLHPLHHNHAFQSLLTDAMSGLAADPTAAEEFEGGTVPASTSQQLSNHALQRASRGAGATDPDWLLYRHTSRHNHSSSGHSHGPGQSASLFASLAGDGALLQSRSAHASTAHDASRAHLATTATSATAVDASSGLDHQCGSAHCVYDRRVILERIALERQLHAMEALLNTAQSEAQAARRRLEAVEQAATTERDQRSVGIQSDVQQRPSRVGGHADTTDAGTQTALRVATGSELVASAGDATSVPPPARRHTTDTQTPIDLLGPLLDAVTARRGRLGLPAPSRCDAWTMVDGADLAAPYADASSAYILSPLTPASALRHDTSALSPELLGGSGSPRWPGRTPPSAGPYHQRELPTGARRQHDERSLVVAAQSQQLDEQTLLLDVLRRELLLAADERDQQRAAHRHTLAQLADLQQEHRALQQREQEREERLRAGTPPDLNITAASDDGGVLAAVHAALATAGSGSSSTGVLQHSQHNSRHLAHTTTTTTTTTSTTNSAVGGGANKASRADTNATGINDSRHGSQQWQNTSAASSTNAVAVGVIGGRSNEASRALEVLRLEVEEQRAAAQELCRCLLEKEQQFALLLRLQEEREAGTSSPRRANTDVGGVRFRDAVLVQVAGPHGLSSPSTTNTPTKGRGTSGRGGPSPATSPSPTDRAQPKHSHRASDRQHNVVSSVRGSTRATSRRGPHDASPPAGTKPSDATTTTATKTAVPAQHRQKQSAAKGVTRVADPAATQHRQSRSRSASTSSLDSDAARRAAAIASDDEDSARSSPFQRDGTAHRSGSEKDIFF